MHVEFIRTLLALRAASASSGGAPAPQPPPAGAPDANPPPPPPPGPSAVIGEVSVRPLPVLSPDRRWLSVRVRGGGDRVRAEDAVGGRSTH